MTNLIPIYFDDIEAAGKDRARISEIRDEIRLKFSTFFNAQGLQRHEPGSLIPQHDESVLFTGSTISTFKPYLAAESIPQDGFYMIQSCLRTQNTKILQDNNNQPQWASYFSSIGALTNYNQTDKISEQTWKFYTDILGVPPDRMGVRIASKDKDLKKHWEDAGLQNTLELDANNPVYYTHKFGMDNVTGRNCNLAIRDHRTNQLRDIGNIIVIETPSKKIGTEIAFGVETIVSRLLGFPNPIAASLIADIVPIKNQHSLKLADAISSSLVILDSGERPVATNRGRVLRKYIQAIGDLRTQADVSLADIRAYAEKFESKEFGLVSHFPAKLEEYVGKYEALKSQGMKTEKINEKLGDIFPHTTSEATKPRTPLSSKLVLT